jgi:O-glycosyl hydrolase
MARRTIVSIAVCLIALTALPPSARTVSIMVNSDKPGQIWEGWGATDGFGFDTLQVEPEAGAPGEIPVEGRKQILKLYYHDLGMNRIRVSTMGYEPENDNSDPHILNPQGFNWEGRGPRPLQSMNSLCRDHLVLGSKYRSRKERYVFYPFGSTSGSEYWMASTPIPRSQVGDAQFNPAMAEEYAEHTLAGILHVKEVYHYDIPYWSVFNEPSNGVKMTKETALALVLATGRRLAENHLKTKLVICDDVTPEDSAATIEYVLADEEARKYVGAVSYHRYRGDFVLERVKPMLAKVDSGEPLIEGPVSFYNSAAKYGKSVWLSEQCSYGDHGITYADTGRARANHICDEINNGKVNAFDFMLCYFIERGAPGNEECPIFLRFKDGKYSGCEINTFGSWISQFTRYIRPGAQQLEVRVDDPLVKAVAFRNRKNLTLTLVVVNNHPEPVSVHLSFCNCCLSSGLERVRTFATENRRRLKVLESNHGFSDAVPGTSVTTYIATPAQNVVVGPLTVGSHSQIIRTPPHPGLLPPHRKW